MKSLGASSDGRLVYHNGRCEVVVCVSMHEMKIALPIVDGCSNVA